jgi:hypothetical protein
LEHILSRLKPEPSKLRPGLSRLKPEAGGFVTGISRKTKENAKKPSVKAAERPEADRAGGAPVSRALVSLPFILSILHIDNLDTDNMGFNSDNDTGNYISILYKSLKYGRE